MFKALIPAISSIFQIPKFSETKVYALTTVLSLGISILFLIVLPEIGYSKFVPLFSPLNFIILTGVAIGFYGYVKYLRFILGKSERFFLFYVLTVDFFVFSLKVVESQLGLSLKVTTLSSLLYMIPMFLLILQFPMRNLWRIPLVNYMCVFFAVSLLYYVFYNHHAVDLLYKTAGQYTPIAWSRVVSVFNIAVLLVATSQFLQFIPDPEAFFDRFTKYYFLTIVVFSVSAIVFYPFNILTVVIETKRMALFFAHPNAFAQYLSLAICFLAGAAFYYLQKSQMGKAKLLFISLPIIFVALITCGSKTALIITLIGISIILLLEAIFNKQKFAIFRSSKAIGLMIVLLFSVAILAAQFGALEGMQQRFSNDGSFSWRVQQWQRILMNVDSDKIFFGHGHTAALIQTQRFVYNTWNLQKNIQESPYVHNSLIEHCYDYGIWGFVWFLGFLHCLVIHIKGLFSNKVQKKYRSIHISCLAIFFVQMSSLLFNESFYLPSPLSVWFLWVIQYFMATIPQYKTDSRIVHSATSLSDTLSVCEAKQ